MKHAGNIRADVRGKRVAVMGTGTMGPGMGAVLARAGMQVTMYDTSAEALERAKAGYDLAWGVLDRLETPTVAGGTVAYVTSVADALKGAEFVIEAIPENLELKKKVYAEYEQHVGPNVILASNTSGIPQRGNMRVKICVRVDRRWVMRPSSHGEVHDRASSSGTYVRIAFATAIARSASRMPTWTCIPNVLLRQAM